jgi:hypothetical protein
MGGSRNQMIGSMLPSSDDQNYGMNYNRDELNSAAKLSKKAEQPQRLIR